MEIRKTDRAWMGILAGLLIGVMGAAPAAAAEAQQPVPKKETPKASTAPGSTAGTTVKESRTPGEPPVDKAETKEMKARRLEHKQKAKMLRSAGLRTDLDHLKALRETEKARREAEKAKRTQQESPGRADVKAAK